MQSKTKGVCMPQPSTFRGAEKDNISLRLIFQRGRPLQGFDLRIDSVRSSPMEDGTFFGGGGYHLKRNTKQLRNPPEETCISRCTCFFAWILGVHEVSQTLKSL